MGVNVRDYICRGRWEGRESEECMFVYTHVLEPSVCVCVMGRRKRGRLSLQTCPGARQYRQKHNEQPVTQREIKLKKKGGLGSATAYRPASGVVGGTYSHFTFQVTNRPLQDTQT